MAKKNPIERRLAVLHDQWTEFAQNPDARLLRWEVLPDEIAMVETFVAMESEPEVCKTPDLFLRFDEPFLHPTAHGYVLRESLIKLYEQARPELEKEGLDASFVAPNASSTDDDIRAFLKLLDAYHAHQNGQIVLLAAFLHPDEVHDGRSYQLWLQRLLHQAPAHLRFLLVDAQGAQCLPELGHSEPVLVVSTAAGLDMSAAAEEISAEAGDLDTPGGKFRQLFVALGSAAKAADIAKALPLAGAATTLASALGWSHLAAVVQMMLASIYAALGQHLDALRCYSEAERHGTATYQHGESGQPAPAGAVDVEGETAKMYGLRMRREARFGQGASLIATGRWGTAAKVYLDAAPLTHALGDARGELDAFRLASLCYAKDGKITEAWHCGMKGLEVAGGMDDEARKTSTLPYLGEDMLHLTTNSEYAPYRPALEKNLKKMLGEDFRSSPAAPARSAP